MKIKTGIIFGGVIFFIGVIMMLIPLVKHDFSVMAIQHLEFVEVTTEYENINRIEISLRGESINIIRNDELVDRVRVTRSDYVSDERFTVSPSNNTLNIRKNGGFWLRELRFFGHNFDTLVTIEIPNDMINTVHIEGRSGRVQISDFTFDNLEVRVRSGRISLEDVTVNNQLRLETKSGRIDINNVNALNQQNETRINVSSGRINVENSLFHGATLSASSGNINVYNTTINILNSTVVSGRMTFDNFTTQEVNADARSGRIVMRINGDREDFSVAVITRSGSSNISSIVRPGAPYTLALSVRSGRIDVTFI